MRVDLSDVLIALDLDGTLVDSAPDLIGALNRILTDRGLEPVPLEEGRPLISGGVRRLLERGFARVGAPFDEGLPEMVVDHFIEIYRTRIVNETKPYPGVEATLDALSAAGARLAVCTNKRTDLALTLIEAVGLAGRFSAVVGPDRVGARKPDPRHLLETIALAGGRPDRAVMVGDTSADVGAARAAGVPVVVVGFGYADVPPAKLGGDVVIARFDELPAAATALMTRRR